VIVPDGALMMADQTWGAVGHTIHRQAVKAAGCAGTPRMLSAGSGNCKYCDICSAARS
jgi:hypothetical protein